jgi:hypothetical protein
VKSVRTTEVHRLQAFPNIARAAGAVKLAVRSFVHHVRFALAARYFRVLPTSSRSRALPLLRAAWGNPGFTANVAFLQVVLDHAQSVPGPILECGSGLTTVLAALSAPAQPVWSLEHIEEWRRYVQMRLMFARTDANVLLTPLASFGRFQWYRLPAALPNAFPLVICDGPPGTTPGGRYGLLPLVRERLPKGAVILLDDAERSNEQAVLKRWQDEAGWHYTIKEHGLRAYAIVTVGGQATRPCPAPLFRSQ